MENKKSLRQYLNVF